MKMRKTLAVFLAILLLLSTMLGCSRTGSPAIAMNTDASIGSFEWGTEKADISAKAKELGLTASESERFITLSEVPLFDTTATVNLSFASFTQADYPTLSEDTPLLLVGVNVLLHSADKESIRTVVSGKLGEQETKQIVFYDEAGDFGYKEGNELDEAAYYWHSEKNLLESIGIERLSEVYPELNHKEIVQKFYAAYGYVVYIKDANDVPGLEEGTVMLEISAASTVVEKLIGA